MPFHGDTSKVLQLKKSCFMVRALHLKALGVVVPKMVRLTDQEVLEKLKAHQKAVSAQSGCHVSFAQVVNAVLRKGFAAIEAQPRKGVR